MTLLIPFLAASSSSSKASSKGSPAPEKQAADSSSQMPNETKAEERVSPEVKKEPAPVVTSTSNLVTPATLPTKVLIYLIVVE